MKNLHFLLFAILLSLGSCHKDDDPTAPIDQLPLATQTGAGTFACLVDGKPFIDNSGSFNCFYQFVDGGYYFHISGTNYDFIPGGIDIGTINMIIAEGQTYPLLEEVEGNASAALFFQDILETSTTNMEYTGELKITKFNLETNIVSGTFWFNIKHPITSEIFEIREGRFDSHFTR
jgi:hypothetical protein